MSKAIHRQISRFGQRSVDDASVAMIIKEVEDTDMMLGRLIEHTKTWRDSWVEILSAETRVADTFLDVYQTIPTTSTTLVAVEETDPETLARVESLRAAYEDLKRDMGGEVARVETLLVAPMGDIRNALKPVRKVIEKREGKKLDYERFLKAVDGGKAKKAKDYAGGQTKNEVELERATMAYEAADDYIRDYIPPILAKVVEFLPIVVHVSVEVQFTLLQNAYSALFAYAQDYGLSDPEAAVVVAEWEALFLPIKQHIESDLKMIAKGKAVTMPMSYIKDTSILGKLPSNPMARGKKPPPPPPPAGDGASPPPPGGRENHRIGSGDIGRQNHRIGSGDMGRQKSSTSLSSRFSRSDSSPPPVPRTRPTAPPSESPSPPRTAEHKPSVARIGSYGSGMGGGGVTPTPLAGLRPSALRSGSSPSAYGNGSSPSAHGNGIGGSSSPHAALAAATSGRIGRSLTPASRSPASGRSPSPSQLAEIVAGKKKPPPPPPKKKFGAAKNEVWVKALFTFEGQDRGDLGFVEGERIRVLKKTESMDDWWEGEVGERKGQFPANYCELIK